MKIYNKITEKSSPKLAVLIDPQNATNEYLENVFQEEKYVDFFLVGGSLVWKDIDCLIEKIKLKTEKPVVLFPGNYFQISTKADGILYLSLISGRNPEYLISQHVQSAMILNESDLEVIPTGYILLSSDKQSTTEYITNTKPIPSEKVEIIVATAVAGKLLGMKIIYLEAGSGANISVSENVIEQVKKQTKLPIFVGGGITTPQIANRIARSGADVIVVGNAIEKNPRLIPEIKKAINNWQ